jgi:hypothetical protein
MGRIFGELIVHLFLENCLENLNFDDLLTAHVGIILAIDQLNAQILVLS